MPRFLELDIQFHSLLLTGSGNEMFANMVGQVAETLTGRTVHGLMPDHPRDTALQWHVDVAEAIAAGNAAGGPRGLEPDHAARPSRRWSRAGRTSRGCSSRSSGLAAHSASRSRARQLLRAGLKSSSTFPETAAFLATSKASSPLVQREGRG